MSSRGSKKRFAAEVALSWWKIYTKTERLQDLSGKKKRAKQSAPAWGRTKFAPTAPASFVPWRSWTSTSLPTSEYSTPSARATPYPSSTVSFLQRGAPLRPARRGRSTSTPEVLKRFKFWVVNVKNPPPTNPQKNVLFLFQGVNFQEIFGKFSAHCSRFRYSLRNLNEFREIPMN